MTVKPGSAGWWVLLVACVLALATAASAQRGSSTPIGNSTGGGPETGLLVSGEVVMSDGSPPPSRVAIEMVCSGFKQPQGFTNEKGQFTVQLGTNRFRAVSDSSSVNIAPTAGFGGPQTGTPQLEGAADRSLIGCGLQAVLTGYISDVVELSGRRMSDNPDLGNIVLRKMEPVTGVTVSATSLRAPRDAQRAYERGMGHIERDRYPDAEKELARAVADYPQYAEAWFGYGLALQAQRKTQEARKAYEQAVASDSQFVKPYLSLALLSAQEQNWQDSARHSDTLLKLDPYSYAQGYYYNAVAHYNLGNQEKALSSAREAVKLDRENKLPQARQLLAVLLFVNGELEEAAVQARNYLATAPPNSNLETVKKLLADIEARLGAAR